MFEYIYLLQTRESIKNNETIYKIGRTSQKQLKRFNNYPNGSYLHLHICCLNSIDIESKIINEFKIHFEKVPLYGKEYFSGNVTDMIKIILKNVSYSFDCSSSHNYCKQITELQSKIIKLESTISKLLVHQNKDKKKHKTQEKSNNQVINHTMVTEDSTIAIENDEDVNEETINNDNNTTETNEEETMNNDSNRTETNEQEQQEHKMLFKCNLCDYVTKNKCDLLRHMRRKTPCNPNRITNVNTISATDTDTQNNDNLQCKKCKKYFSRIDNLKNHLKKCDGLDPLQCKRCLKFFNTRFGKCQHMKNVKCERKDPSLNITINNDNTRTNNTNDNLQCKKCMRYFSRSDNLKNHIKKCDGLDSLQCKKCFKFFNTRQGKFQHMKNVKCELKP